MIDAIHTALSGRMTSLNRVEPVRPAKLEQTEQKEAPKSEDSLVLSSEAVELYNSVTAASETENYTENNDSQDLSEDEEKEVEELKERDAEVRSHEQAHMTAGAPYTSSPSYEYTTGPDNVQYATEGEVDVDTSEESTPEKTIEKAQTIKRSASAPAEPSTQDRRVAAEAAQMEREARAELRQQKSSGTASYGIQAYMQASTPTAGSYINASF